MCLLLLCTVDRHHRIVFVLGLVRSGQAGVLGRGLDALRHENSVQEEVAAQGRSDDARPETRLNHIATGSRLPGDRRAEEGMRILSLFVIGLYLISTNVPFVAGPSERCETGRGAGRSAGGLTVSGLRVGGTGRSADGADGHAAERGARLARVPRFVARLGILYVHGDNTICVITI